MLGVVYICVAILFLGVRRLMEYGQHGGGTAEDAEPSDASESTPKADR